MRYAFVMAILALGLAGCNLNGVKFDVSGLPSLDVNGNCQNNSPQDGSGTCTVQWDKSDKGKNDQPADDVDELPDDDMDDRDPIVDNPGSNPTALVLPTGTWTYGGTPENSSLGLSYSAATTDWSGGLSDRNATYVVIEADFSKNRVNRFDGYVSGSEETVGNYEKYLSLDPKEDILTDDVNPHSVFPKFIQKTGVVIDPETGGIEGRIFRISSPYVFDVAGQFSSDGVTGNLDGFIFDVSDEIVNHRDEYGSLADLGEFVDWEGIGRFQADKGDQITQVNLPSGLQNYWGEYTLNGNEVDRDTVFARVDFDDAEFIYFRIGADDNNDGSIRRGSNPDYQNEYQVYFDVRQDGITNTLNLETGNFRLTGRHFGDYEVNGSFSKPNGQFMDGTWSKNGNSGGFTAQKSDAQW